MVRFGSRDGSIPRNLVVNVGPESPVKHIILGLDGGCGISLEFCARSIFLTLVSGLDVFHCAIVVRAIRCALQKSFIIHAIDATAHGARISPNCLLLPVVQKLRAPQLSESCNRIVPVVSKSDLRLVHQSTYHHSGPHSNPKCPWQSGGRSYYSPCKSQLGDVGRCEGCQTDSYQTPHTSRCSRTWQDRKTQHHSA